MATPNEHAKISASSYERWIHCTAAPLYEVQFQTDNDGGTPYTAEGTLAHSVCELKARKQFFPDKMTTRKYNAALKKLKTDPFWNDEMLVTADFYVNFLRETANQFETMPLVYLEQRVEFTDYVPEGFGTCDCVMIGGDTIRITDYKHGKGVPVSSVNNGQMRLYALGALAQTAVLFGDKIKRVCTAIVQPRLSENVTEEWLTVEELKEWGKTVVMPKAFQAFYGFGTFSAGDWCRFCKGKAECRARAEYYAGFGQYEGMRVEGSDKSIGSANEATTLPLTLSDDDVGTLLMQAEGLMAWYSDLQEYARDAILAGRKIPGWRVVEGRKTRAFTDADKALDLMRNAGYDDAVLYEHKAKSLAELEKLTGKKAFAEIMGDVITWPQGKPTLVHENDKRPDYSSCGPEQFEGADNV